MHGGIKKIFFLPVFSWVLIKPFVGFPLKSIACPNCVLDAKTSKLSSLSLLPSFATSIAHASHLAEENNNTPIFAPSFSSCRSVRTCSFWYVTSRPIKKENFFQPFKLKMWFSWEWCREIVYFFCISKTSLNCTMKVGLYRLTVNIVPRNMFVQNRFKLAGKNVPSRCFPLSLYIFFFKISRDGQTCKAPNCRILY